MRVEVQKRRHDLRESKIVPEVWHRQAFLQVNAYADGDVPVLRRRLELIETVPEVAARAAVRYAAWEQAIAVDAASRWRCSAGELRPQVFARVVVAAMAAIRISGAVPAWLAEEWCSATQ